MNLNLPQQVTTVQVLQHVTSGQYESIMASAQTGQYLYQVIIAWCAIHLPHLIVVQ